MDWHDRETSVFATDQRKILKFTQQQLSKVVQVLRTHPPQLPRPCVIEQKDDASLKTWLATDVPLRRDVKHGGVCVILARRGREIHSNAAILEHIPFTEPTWNAIFSSFQLHISFIRVINRGAALFSRTFFNKEKSAEGMISYHLRMTNVEPQIKDLAMSATANTRTKITNALILGCDVKDMEQFEQRLTTAGPAISHPMLIPGLFVEVQRKKHVEVVGDSTKQLLHGASSFAKEPDRALNIIQAGGGDPTTDNVPLAERWPQELMRQWIQISYLNSGLETWKSQMQKMVTHIDELNNGLFKGDTEMVPQGNRIKERLQDIIVEYDEMIRKCTMASDGLSLSNGMTWNHLARKDNDISTNISRASYDLSMASKRDSSQMKAIALLTMFFLPGAYVASLFAMPIFNWPKEDNVYGSYFWIYWITAGLLTVFVVSLWGWWSWFSEHSAKKKTSKQEGN